ncbi:MAG: large-conductance mechanosensitive channel protein MscL [Paludibacteraceae bacterium]|nr:large-conductance mechanosensitive channel protein MscL [Paludibacteraceae bacterium]
MKIFREFRDFAVQGNVVDMAVGVIIGSSLGKVVTSLVRDIIMPPIGFFIKGLDFNDMKFVMHVIGTKRTVTLNYGSFFQVLIDFLIVAFTVFIAIKALEGAKRKRNKGRETEQLVDLSHQEQLLTEIRDLLKEQGGKDSTEWLVQKDK